MQYTLADSEFIFLPYSIFALLASAFSFLTACAYLKTAGSRLIRRDDDFQSLEENEEEAFSRIGNSLSLGQDLYAWSFVGCFSREFIALKLFQHSRDAMGAKRKQELKDAKTWLARAKGALEEEPGDKGLRASLAYAEKQVAQKSEAYT